MYFLKFSVAIAKRLAEVMIIRRKEEQWATARLAEMEANAGMTLPGGTKKKVITSYSIYQPMVVEAFAELRGRGVSWGERERMLQYFICSATFDDFTDEEELTIAELNDIAYAPAVYMPRTAQEYLFLKAHTALSAFVRDQDAYEEACQGVFDAQVNSVRQTDPDLTNEEIYKITVEKGAYAVLLCDFYMDEDGSGDTWRDCWFLLGGIIQLTNDLFDTWKDLQAGLQTLPTRMKDVHQLYHLFMGMVQELEAAIAALPVPEKRRRRFRMHMMAICSFGDIALHQFRGIQEEHGGLPALRTLPRKALIIDMEKPRNVWHCMRFIYRRCRS